MTISPLPGDDEIARAHAEIAYGLGETKFPAWLEWARELAARRAAEGVRAALTGPRPRVLDIGCGSGAFLRYMSQGGCEIHGTELEGPAYDRASRVEGIHLTPDALVDESFPPEHFDAITLWHVLEHLREPVAVVRLVHRFLKPEGLLFIEVPDLDSAQARLFGRHWLHLDPPRHLYQYTSGALDRLLTGNGFAVIRRERFSLSMGSFGYLQSLLNVFMPSRDLFYNLLLTRGRAPAGLPEKALAYGLGVMLSPLALLLSLTEGATGKGAVIRVACRKA